MTDATPETGGWWGGRTRNMGYPSDGPGYPHCYYDTYACWPDLSLGPVAASLLFPYKTEMGPAGGDPVDPAVLVENLTPNQAYNVTWIAWEQGWDVGYDIYANGTKMVEDAYFYYAGVPASEDPPEPGWDVTDEHISVKFVATADGDGKILFVWNDLAPDTQDRFSGLIMEPVPEPGTLVLLLGLAGFVCFRRRR
jgi:hypothetical protein